MMEKIYLSNKRLWIIVTSNCKACSILLDVVENVLNKVDYEENVFVFNDYDINLMPKKIVDKLNLDGYPILIVVDNNYNVLYQQVGTISKTELTKILLQ